MAGATAVLVVPCFDADQWLNVEEIVAWLARSQQDALLKTSLLFVHAGSSRVDKLGRKINRWLDAIAYSVPSRSQPGRVRIMQLKRHLSRAEALRQGLLEASEWPPHFGGRPDYVGWWSLDLSEAPLDGISSLATALAAHPTAVPAAAFGRGRNLVGGAFLPFLLGLPPGLRASTGPALFRTCSELSRAIRTPFHHERLVVFELMARLLPPRPRTSDAVAMAASPLCLCDVPIDDWADRNSCHRRWAQPPSLAEWPTLVCGVVYLRLLLCTRGLWASERMAQALLLAIALLGTWVGTVALLGLAKRVSSLLVGASTLWVPTVPPAALGPSRAYEGQPRWWRRPFKNPTRRASL